MKIAKFAILLSLVFGCQKQNQNQELGTSEKPEFPKFTIAVSEYPSWSVLIVASKSGIVKGAEGEMSELEKTHGVDLVIEVKDYDPCLAMYNNNAVDATCVTNIDVLNSSVGRQSTAICPTSTSDGADKVIAVGYKNLEEMAGVKTYGLAKSVSQFSFYREVEKSNLDHSKYPFENLDPAAAATAIQSNVGEIKSVCVWNPYALQTLRSNTNSVVITDSSKIPEEIIDMIVVGNDVLKKDGGENFAKLLCKTYYEVCKKMNDPDKSVADATLASIGEDFSNLPLEDMRLVVKETKFYDTPEKGIELFNKKEFHTIMESVVIPTCQKIGILDPEKSPPTVGYDDPTKNLNFSTKFMSAN